MGPSVDLPPPPPISEPKFAETKDLSVSIFVFNEIPSCCGQSVFLYPFSQLVIRKPDIRRPTLFDLVRETYGFSNAVRALTRLSKGRQLWRFMAVRNYIQSCIFESASGILSLVGQRL